jgi:hypothetical protein
MRNSHQPCTPSQAGVGFCPLSIRGRRKIRCRNVTCRDNCKGMHQEDKVRFSSQVAKRRAYAYRTQGLYYFYSCFIFSELVGRPIASIAADISPWLHFLISYVLLLLTFPLLVIMPKDHKAPAPTPPTGDPAEDLPASQEHGRSILQTVLHASLDQFCLFCFMLFDHNMCLAAVVFLISTFRGISLRALAQYAPSRFDWKLSRASLVAHKFWHRS